TRAAGRACMEELRALGVRFERASQRRLIATPIVIPDLTLGAIRLEPTFRKGPFVMDCRLALALTRQADMLAALGVRALRFSSIHDVRPVRLAGTEGKTLSRHSLGLAIDVFELRLASGARLVVEDDAWSWNPTVLLVEVALRSSGAFRAVLGPGVDPVSHADHIHLEARVEPGPAKPRVARKGARARKARKAARARKARKAARARKARKAARARKARKAARARKARKAERARKARKAERAREAGEERARVKRAREDRAERRRARREGGRTPD